MIGIAGAHRTGKSTLAREFSERSGIPYVQTSTSETFKRLGADPKVDYSLHERIAIQMAILDDIREQYAAAPRIFVADRTPIDMMAYMLADVTRAGVTPEADEKVMRYLDLCMEVSKRFFSAYMVVQPGIPLVEEEGKAPAVPSYIEHINFLIIGLLLGKFNGSVNSIVLDRNCTDLEARVAALMKLAFVTPSTLVNSPSDQKRLT